MKLSLYTCSIEGCERKHRAKGYCYKHWHKQWKYGITPEDYEARLAEQGGKCAICRQPETQVMRGTLQSLAVDHCHETGEVRGLLCTKCNVGIGQFNDEPTLVQAALDYLS